MTKKREREKKEKKPKDKKKHKKGKKAAPEEALQPVGGETTHFTAAPPPMKGDRDYSASYNPLVRIIFLCTCTV